jgi:predicted N-formylglutamate amidohydrolase
MSEIGKLSTICNKCSRGGGRFLVALPHDVEIDATDPVAVENVGGAGPFVIVCDHASNRFPGEFGSLGLAAEDREAHIAWDPGALGVSRRLARMLDAPLVYATVSRLVIDCNRPLDAPDLIAAASETTSIPGNAALPQVERRRRIAAIHEPYHRAIDSVIDARLAAGRDTTLVAIHSFTPVYCGIRRPWQVGVIFDRDRRLADRLIDGLRASGLKVGVNEPYSPADRVYYTLNRHADPRGLAAAMIEMRNDLIGSEANEQAWAERIGALLASCVPPTGKTGGEMIAGER